MNNTCSLTDKQKSTILSDPFGFEADTKSERNLKRDAERIRKKSKKLVKVRENGFYTVVEPEDKLKKIVKLLNKYSETQFYAICRIIPFGITYIIIPESQMETICPVEHLSLVECCDNSPKLKCHCSLGEHLGIKNLRYISYERLTVFSSHARVKLTVGNVVGIDCPKTMKETVLEIIREEKLSRTMSKLREIISACSNDTFYVEKLFKLVDKHPEEKFYVIDSGNRAIYSEKELHSEYPGLEKFTDLNVGPSFSANLRDVRKSLIVISNEQLKVYLYCKQKNMI